MNSGANPGTKQGATPGNKANNRPGNKRGNLPSGLNLSPQQIEKLRPLAKLVSSFGASIMLSFVFFGLLPLPWSIAGIFTLAWAVYQGIRAFKRSKTTENGHLFTTSLTLSLVFGIIVLFTALSSMITWPAQWKWHECNQTALTVAAQQQCTTQFSENSQNLVERLLGGGTSQSNSGN